MATLKRISVETGEHLTYDATTTFVDGSAMDDNLVDGVVYRKKDGQYYVSREPNRKLYAWRYNIKPDTGEVIPLDKLIKYYTACARLRRVAKLQSGKYIYPENYQANLGFMDIFVEGEDDGSTIITSKTTGVTMARPERIDLKKAKPPVANAFYQVDQVDRKKYYTSGVLDAVQYKNVHPSWETAVHAAELNDYIKVVDGVASMSNFAEVKAAGLVTELDLSSATPTAPTVDGLYVVSGGGGPSGGGYGHLELPQAFFNTDGKKVPYLLGTVLKRVGGIWSRQDFSHGWVTGGTTSLKYIQFVDCNFYIFTPKTDPYNDLAQANVKGRGLFIEKCKFNHVSRVCGLDRWGLNLTGSGGWQDFAGLVPGRYNHFISPTRFNYESIIIRGNEYRNIHTAMYWEFPKVSTRMIVEDELVEDCFTNIECYLYNPYGEGGDIDSRGIIDSPEYTSYRNITFNRVRKYDPVLRGFHLLRSIGRANYENIKVLDSNGICFYIGGSGNTIKSCYIDPHMEDYGATVAGLGWALQEVFHLKGLTDLNPFGSDVLSDCTVTGGWVTPLDQKYKSVELKVNNCSLTSSGYFKTIYSGVTELDTTLMYYIPNTASLTIFQTLATGVDGTAEIRRYDETITAGHYVYFDKRQDRWQRWHKGPLRNQGLLERSTDTMPGALYRQDITFTGCTLRCSNLIKVQSSSYSKITINGGVIETASDIVMASASRYVKELYLNNVIWVKGVEQNTTYQTTNVDQFYANNVTLVYQPRYTPTILFTDKCEWNNSHVVPDTTYQMSDYNSYVTKLPDSTAYGAVRFKGTGANATLNISGGSVNARNARLGCVELDGIKNLYCKGLKADTFREFDGSGTEIIRDVFLFSAGLAANELIVEDLSVDFPSVNSSPDNIAVTARALFYQLSGSPAVTIGRLKVGNIKTHNGGLTHNRIASGAGITITNVEIQKPADYVAADTVIPNAGSVVVLDSGKRTVSANTAVTKLDKIILVDTTAGNVTISISVAELAYTTVTIKKISSDSNQLIIQPASGTIEGQSSIIYTEQWTGATVTAAGTNFIHL